MAGVGIDFETGRDAYTENAFSNQGGIGGAGGNAGLFMAENLTQEELAAMLGTAIVLGIVALVYFKGKRG